MTLTAEQIEHLFNFTRKKYVRYYDLQVELVDHLASAIEDEMLLDSNVSFENALQTVYKRFGITGFSKVVTQKRSALEKYWRKRMLSYMKEYFRIPKIILLVCLTGIIYQVFQLMKYLNITSFAWVIPIFLLLFIGGEWYYVKTLNKTKFDSQKDLLTVESFNGMMFLPSFVLTQIMLHFLIQGNFFESEWWVMIILATLISFLLIFYHACLFVFPQWLKEEVETKYPNYISAIKT